jgi:succinate dehydrogenase/fumarate reductase flavoprotein subunit
MGGIKTDDRGQTSLPGLYACGEVVWGMHGANRRGGNALTECAVMGRLAGIHAADYAGSNPFSSPLKVESGLAWAQGGSSQKASLKEIRTRLREIAWEHAGVIRSADGIQTGLAKLEDTESELGKTRAENVDQLKLKRGLMAGCFVLKAVLTASAPRHESRGSFVRSDFPNEDDHNWLKNSCLTYDETTNAFSLSYHPVNTTDI